MAITIGGVETNGSQSRQRQKDRRCYDEKPGWETVQGVPEDREGCHGGGYVQTSGLCDRVFIHKRERPISQ